MAAVEGNFTGKSREVNGSTAFCFILRVRYTSHKMSIVFSAVLRYIYVWRSCNDVTFCAETFKGFLRIRPFVCVTGPAVGCAMAAP